MVTMLQDEQQAADPRGTEEFLHRIVGSLEVARDIVARTRNLYSGSAPVADDEVLGCMAFVGDVLGRVVESLETELGRVGPAA